MKILSTLHSMLLLVTVLLLSTTACDKDDDDMPEPQVTPVAAFSVEANADNGLEITFTNDSQNASSYEWDFGDGNTSTEENPTHTYEEAGTFTVALTASNATESSKTSQEITVTATELYKTKGYYVTSVSNSSGGTTFYGGYFPELPSGDIDLTQYESFPLLIVRAQYGAFLYATPTDGTSTGLTKYAVDAKSNQLVEVATLPTITSPSTVVIVDEKLGFYANFRDLSVTVFNPTSMEEINVIDLSANTPTNQEFDTGVTGLFYNEITGKVLATLYVDNPNTGQFYDDTSVYVEVIDVETQTREKTITHPNASYAIFRGNTNDVIDDEGNLYLVSQGSYGLDGQVGATAAVSSRPQILKINTNSEFEVDYAWNPISAFGFEDNFFQLFTSMIAASGKKAYGYGTAGPESQEILVLLGKLSAGTITAAEYDQLQFLVFAEESLKLMEIDLAAKTATFVEGAPFTAGFSYPILYDYDGTIFAQMASDNGTFNGYYSIDPTTSVATSQFNITQGGLATYFVKLSE